jgi:hypothetical protein
MKKVPVFTMQQLADLSVEELKETIRREWNSEWPNPSRMLPPPSSSHNLIAKFFVKTKDGTVNLSDPPIIDVIDSQGQS